MNVECIRDERVNAACLQKAPSQQVKDPLGQVRGPRIQAGVLGRQRGHITN